jgi:hypothetical protein
MVLLALTGGVFYSEAKPGGAGLPTWTAAFPTAISSGPGASGSAPDGATSSADLSFNQTNITMVTFQFSFTDVYRFSTISPAGATFKVTSPLGLTGESSLSPGQATATGITIRQVCSPPDGDQFGAATADDAARMCKTRYPASENGTGDWTVEITVTRDYMTPVHTTGSIAWTATTKVTTYTLELSEKLYG